MALFELSAGSTLRILRAVGVIGLAIFARGFFVLYQKRMQFRRLAAKHGLDILPHSFIFGHLISLGMSMAKHPADLNGQVSPLVLARDHPELAKDGVLYVDLWPISYQMLAVFHPDMMAQFCQENSQLKHEQVRWEFYPLTKNKDLVTTDGAQWKRWRSVFNPGFSTQNIMSLVPGFVEEVLVFKRYLEGIAMTGEAVALETQGMKATCDIIGRAVIGKSLGIQTTPDNPLFKALKKNIAWLIPEWAPRQWGKMMHPLRQLSVWRNNAIMRRELRPLIEEQYKNSGHVEGPKTIVNLAIRTYVKENGQSSAGDMIDPEFVDATIEHIKMFLFAGHDTTASTLSFIYYSLHENPEIMAKVRAEHDAVLGADPSQAANIISRTPALLNQLPFTLAVVRETLRMYPPVGSVRAGSPDYFLTNPETGRQYPTENLMLFSCSYAMQRDATYWAEPDTFNPERWLTKDGEPAQLRKNTWRPFELGPRSCIGQELAVTELKLILALTLRELDIVPMYEPTGERFFGALMYQAHMPGELTAHPKGGMPVMVKKRVFS
ncbi:cytochrome P450 [Trichoderma velutinum]